MQLNSIINKILILSLSFFISGCKEYKVNKLDINPELVGTWRGGSCEIELSILNYRLWLKEFKIAQKLILRDIPLELKKESIMNLFAAPPQNFSGSFNEGLIILNDGRCGSPLHKNDQY